jgi:hypothetical protein
MHLKSLSLSTTLLNLQNFQSLPPYQAITLKKTSQDLKKLHFSKSLNCIE